jgi:hypothetical protein
VAWNWRNPFGQAASTVSVSPQSLVGWTVETRPEHLLRFEELRKELAGSVFNQTTHTDQASQAFFWIAGLINNQLALMQKAGLLDTEGERILRGTFSLGYLFGIAAWFSDERGIARPSADADRLVVLAHQEALGPLPAEQIVRLSAAAARTSEFTEGMESAALDLKDLRNGSSRSASMELPLE